MIAPLFFRIVDKVASTSVLEATRRKQICMEIVLMARRLGLDTVLQCLWVQCLRCGSYIHLTLTTNRKCI